MIWNDTNEQRRRFLRRSATLIPTIGLSTSLVGLPAYGNDSSPSLGDYQPEFFDADEWRFLLAACDRLIPKDSHGAGALEANAPIYIDLQMQGYFGHAEDWYMSGPHEPDAAPERGYQSPLTPRETYRQGIAAFNQWCKKAHGKHFADLDDAVMDTALVALEKGETGISAIIGTQFFEFLLENTREGFFADPIHGGNKNMVGWKMIGFPGARASYREWVGQYNQPYPLGPVDINGNRG